MNNPAPVKVKATKAIVAGILSALFAFFSSIATALQGGSTGWSTITAGQWVTAIIAVIVSLGATLGVTYYVPNNPKV